MHIFDSDSDNYTRRMISQAWHKYLYVYIEYRTNSKRVDPLINSEQIFVELIELDDVILVDVTEIVNGNGKVDISNVSR